MKKSIIITVLSLFFGSIVAAQDNRNLTDKVEQELQIESKRQPKDDVQTKAALENRIYLFVEQKAEFPGGEAEMAKFMIQNFRLPSKIEQPVGKIIFSFVVEKNGFLSDIKVIKGETADIDNVVIRVVKSMPQWSSAQNNGKVVRSKVTIPFSIHLE